MDEKLKSENMQKEQFSMFVLLTFCVQALDAYSGR